MYVTAGFCLQQQESREPRAEHDTETAAPVAAVDDGGGSFQSAQTHPGQVPTQTNPRRVAENPQPLSEGASIQSSAGGAAAQTTATKVLRNPKLRDDMYGIYASRLKTASECLELLKDDIHLPDGVYSLVEKQMEDLHVASPAAQQRQAAFDVLMAAGLRPETHQRWSRRLATFEDCMELLEKHDSLPGGVHEMVHEQFEIITGWVSADV